MTTQNIEYSDEVKSFPLVASAFEARDDVQVDVLAIKEEMEKLNEQVQERQRALDRKLETLAVADDKLALVAAMAQDCIDKIEVVKAECDKSLKSALDSLTDVSEGIDSEDSVISSSDIERERVSLALILGIDLSAGDNDQDSEEVQEELALTG